METAITLTSGHILELGDPGFQAGRTLFKTLARELMKVEVTLESLDMKKLLAQDVNSFKNVFLMVASSEAIESSIFECAGKSILQGQKITPGSFEPMNMRQDYLPVAWEVLKFTLSPFFASLGLSLLGSAGPNSKSLG